MVATLAYKYPDNSGTCLLDLCSYVTGDNKKQLIFHDISEALPYIVRDLKEKIKNSDLTWYTARFTLNNREYEYHFLSSLFIGMEDNPKEIWDRLGLCIRIQTINRYWQRPSFN